eukprot:CAMPEP_0113314400 /NCGR_PEP_ID=MMETSP0010_2-20120614/10472_1 /TAXON_ID=216773 ORGANISM="Corethron hystrix, Strain 308" /NCGR_SAMPLE_ID=MMETSP0010_2 /ASSEMBLY_ACC=CAM_ASM_000155 /LENGTH=171 /DNA_ID=CAMNT_0000170671 /DNA_START=79 /DNA_END=594 /DNA_ORIENTATION=- /assembly_acc=CAM_ASM_000155
MNARFALASIMILIEPSKSIIFSLSVRQEYPRGCIYNLKNVRRSGTFLEARPPKVSDWEFRSPVVSEYEEDFDDAEDLQSDAYSYYSRDDEPTPVWIEKTNGVLSEMRSNFNYFEGVTFKLLSKQPVLAFAIFVAAGFFVAYMLGMMFLQGYINSPNPLENGEIPYWDEEI